MSKLANSVAELVGRTPIVKLNHATRIHAAIETAKRLGKGSNVLAIVPSNGERYLSTALYGFED